jgi:hypothetical protein
MRGGPGSQERRHFPHPVSIEDSKKVMKMIGNSEK